MLLGLDGDSVVAPWVGLAAAAAGIAALVSVCVLQRRRVRRLLQELAAAQAAELDARRSLDQTRKRARELALMAHSAKALRNEFLSNISHEVRTPMNTIVGMTELALATPLNPKQHHYLAEVRDAASSLLGLLNDLLDLAKIHSRRLEMSPSPFKLTECLADVVAKFRPRAAHKGIKLDLDIDPAVPTELVGDPGRLRQVVAALVSNAVKFTEKGSVAVRAETESVQDRNVSIHCWVADTGIGIPPDKHSEIFEDFRQADGSLARTYGGLGIGLTIAAELVSMMGGRMWLESALGKGSTFHFTVRFRLQDAAPATAADGDFGALGGMEALVIHEDRAVRQALEDLVASLHMKATAAASAEAAMSALATAGRAGRRMPVVILGDGAGPGGGFELASRILADAALKGTHILFVTMAGKRGDAARSRRLGLAAYLTFPVTRADLGHSVLAAVQDRPLSESPPFVTKHWLREHHNAV